MRRPLAGQPLLRFTFASRISAGPLAVRITQITPRFGAPAMKKTLILALAVFGVSLTGCTEEEVVETEPIVTEEPAPVVTEPADDMILDDTTGALEEGTVTEENVLADTTTL